MKIYTIGYGKKTAEQFFQILIQSRIERLLDVRLNNRSQIAGFTKKDDLRYFVQQICNAEYVHDTRLAPTQELLDAYRKAGGGWKAYERGFLKLLADRKIESQLKPSYFNTRTVLLCSEPSPEHCHRRLIVEYLARKWGSVVPVHL